MSNPRPDPRMQCRHVFTDGHRCASPCLRHQDFCYYHHTSRRPIENPRARRRRGTTFTLPELEDRAAIQLALSEILQRIAANDLDPRRAGHLLYGLQIAATLLPKVDPKHPPKTVAEITHDEDLGDLAPAQEVGADREPTGMELLMEALRLPSTEPETVPNLQAAAEDEEPEDVPVLKLVILSRAKDRLLARSSHNRPTPPQHPGSALRMLADKLQPRIPGIRLTSRAIRLCSVSARPDLLRSLHHANPTLPPLCCKCLLASSRPNGPRRHARHSAERSL